MLSPPVRSWIAPTLIGSCAAAPAQIARMTAAARLQRRPDVPTPMVRPDLPVALSLSLDAADALPSTAALAVRHRRALCTCRVARAAPLAALVSRPVRAAGDRRARLGGTRVLPEAVVSAPIAARHPLATDRRRVVDGVHLGRRLAAPDRPAPAGSGMCARRIPTVTWTL